MRRAGSSAAVSAVGAFAAARPSSDQKSLAPSVPGSLTVMTCFTVSTARTASAVRSSAAGVVISTRAPLSARR